MLAVIKRLIGQETEFRILVVVMAFAVAVLVTFFTGAAIKVALLTWV